MTQSSLNAKTISELSNPGEGSKIVWDTALRGFGIRLTKASKTYIAEGRVLGRKRRVTIGRSDVLSVQEARREAKKVLGKMASGIDINAEKQEARARSITLLEALDEYLKSRDLKPATAAEYRARLKANFPDWLAKELKAITPTAVVRRFDKLTKEHSPHVANGAFRVFRAVYRYARAYTATDAGNYTLPECPCQRLSDLKRWHKPSRRLNHLTDDQFPAFFEALSQSHNLVFPDFMELILRTGLRRNEAATLTWEDVNMKAGTFRIRAEIAKNGNELVLPMSDQVRALLRRRKEAALGATAVFASSTRYDPRKSLTRLRESLSCEITIHDLRRTYAIQAERAGTPYSLLKRMLNHSSAGDVTLAHYLTGNDPKALRPYVQKVSDMIDKLAGISTGNGKLAHIESQ
ncbi:tyrosine-type recombinase/integrase [Leisingera thetidis]|uniref:tyrosine-type recombinase/integrase n=1 Tax=Leisingera thetidis TaxID=2930199 RepID=UPI0021F79F96|nr:tyrosine-type recombinase/integrase [Leisingera thetidis]